MTSVIDDNKYFIGPQFSLIQLESTKQPFLSEPLLYDWCKKLKKSEEQS